MRIIAGMLGGRVFKSPGTQRTHPMSDRMRGALFAVLGDIQGLTVLDAFAGSGALGLEAVSRGAAHVTTIESDSAAQRAIAQNIAALGATSQMKLIRAAANAWLQTSSPDQQFDIVLCDPPYHDPQLTLLTRLAERARKRGGVVVFSLPPGEQVVLPDEFVPQPPRKYGDAQLLFFVRD